MASLDEPRGMKQWYAGRPEDLTGHVRRLERVLSTERFLDGALVRAYHGRPMIPAGPQATSASTVLPRASLYVAGLEALAQENLLRSVIDTACSQIVREPAFKVITTEGDWSKQVSARKLSRLLDGIATAGGLRDIAAPCMVDAMTCMAGFAKWTIEPDGLIECSRLLPHQVAWNPAEGISPRSIGVRTYASREKIRQEFEGKTVNNRLITSGDIDRLPMYRPTPEFFLDHPWSYLPETDMVEICEAWRTSSSEKDPGQHVMTSGSIVLVDEKWTLDVWPVVPLRWAESYDTFAGVPLARQVLASQMRVNRMNRTIDEAQSKLASAKVLIPMGSEIEQLTNAIAELIPYNAAAGPPVVMAGQILPAEYYAEAQRVRNACYELPGVSQAIAQGTKEPGLNAAVAIRERRDLASGRLVLNAQRLERWYGENARVCLLLMAQAFKGKTARLRGPNQRLIDEVEWDRLHFAREEIQVRAFITSAIPSTPAGRAETIAEWVGQGVISQKRAARWYANPDVAELEDEESAMEDLARKMIDKALYDGEEIPADPILGADGLAMVVDIGSKELAKALVMRKPPPDTNMELLRRLIEEAKLLGAPKPMPTMPGAPMPMPGASPAAMQGPLGMGPQAPVVSPAPVAPPAPALQ